MQCTYPLVIVRKQDGRAWEVPCGRCTSCRIGRAREWATRCVHEAAYWPASGFTTLTYRDEDLPGNGSLDQAEFTRFWKRLRKDLAPRRIRYYGCGEYGETTGRPHYHALIFGLAPCRCSRRQSPGEKCRCPDRCAVFDAWGHGGVDRLGSVSYDSARYCADYIGKALIGKGAEAYGRRSAPFQVMSQGIGRAYVDDNAAELRERLGVTVHGVQVGLPRYYAQRLGISWEEVERGDFEVVPSRTRHSWGTAYPAALLKLEAPRVQRDKDASARVHLFKKGKV